MNHHFMTLLIPVILSGCYSSMPTKIYTEQVNPESFATVSTESSSYTPGITIIEIDFRATHGLTRRAPQIINVSPGDHAFTLHAHSSCGTGEYYGVIDITTKPFQKYIISLGAVPNVPKKTMITITNYMDIPPVDPINEAMINFFGRGDSDSNRPCYTNNYSSNAFAISPPLTIDTNIINTIPNLLIHFHLINSFDDLSVVLASESQRSDILRDLEYNLHSVPHIQVKNILSDTSSFLNTLNKIIQSHKTPPTIGFMVRHAYQTNNYAWAMADFQKYPERPPNNSYPVYVQPYISPPPTAQYKPFVPNITPPINQPAPASSPGMNRVNFR